MLKNLTLIPAIIVLAHSSAYSQSLGDFDLPAGSDSPDKAREVTNPVAVTTTENAQLGEMVVSAETTQDAVNATQQQLIDSGDGATFISTPSGVGAVAVGYGSYSAEFTNPNTKLIEQRQAYLAATIEARVALAEFLKGISIEGHQELVKQFDMVDMSEGSLANIGTYSTESITERVNGMLRGVVIYDVQDNPESGDVSVTVVTTPKTQGAIQFTSDGNLTAHSLENGLEVIFAEIRGGLVPPDGGRIVTVPSSGQIAWVGFGSEINRINDNKEVQRESKRAAIDTAKMRARRSLLAVINGEDINKESVLNQSFSKEIQQFEKIPGVEGEAGIQGKEAEEISAFAEQTKMTVMGSSTIGKLPEGVKVVSYQSRDGSWSYAVATYWAEASAAAVNLSEIMNANSPLGAMKQKSAGFKTNPDGSFKTNDDGRLIPKTIGSGQVTPLEDL
jgi:hypothetical protein